MPIISDIGAIGNLILNLFSKFFKLITEKPQYLILIMLILLCFPLEFIDMFLYFLINIFVVMVNVIIVIFAILINVIISIINFVFGVIIGVPIQIITWIITPINWLLNPLGLSITLPSFTIPSLNQLSYSAWPGGVTIARYNINIFGPGSFTGITCIFDIFGLSSPVW